MHCDTTIGNVNIKINTKRLDENLRRAQMMLNLRVVADSNEYVPMSQGGLRSRVRYPDGIYGGCFEYDSPYAHYQWEGDLYLTEDGRSWANKYEKKYPTGIPLKYHHPGTTDHWFEKAKTEHLEEWIDLVRKEVGKD